MEYIPPVVGYDSVNHKVTLQVRKVKCTLMYNIIEKCRKSIIIIFLISYHAVYISFSYYIFYFCMIMSGPMCLHYNYSIINYTVIDCVLAIFHNLFYNGPSTISQYFMYVHPH